MPETIPLGTYLSVETQHVIIDHAIGTPSLLDFVLIWVSTIAGVGWFVERPVKGDADARDDFFGGSCDDRRRQEIQHAQLVSFSKPTPRIAPWTVGIERER